MNAASHPRARLLVDGAVDTDRLRSIMSDCGACRTATPLDVDFHPDTVTLDGETMDELCRDLRRARAARGDLDHVVHVRLRTREALHFGLMRMLGTYLRTANVDLVVEMC